MRDDSTHTRTIARMIRLGALGAISLSLASGAMAEARAPAAPLRTTNSAAVPRATRSASTSFSAKSSDEVVAHVGATDVTAREVRDYVSTLGPREQAAFAKEPALLSQAVRLMLSDRLVLEEALAKKWDQQPSVAAQLSQLRERAIVELYLQSVSTPPANFPSESELEKTYEAHRSAFLVPRQFQLGHIFIAVPKDGDKSGEEKAKKSVEEIQRKLKVAGADFVSIARAESDAKDGGDLGWVAESQIRPEIRNQAMGMAKNAISEPMRLDDGWHIIRLNDTKTAYTRPLAEARDQLAQQMRAERAAALRRAYVVELLRQHPPMVNEFSLSNVLDSSRK
jgi:parvulin-like peptidyl-prolyl isomerase